MSNIDLETMKEIIVNNEQLFQQVIIDANATLFTNLDLRLARATNWQEMLDISIERHDLILQRLELSATDLVIADNLNTAF